MATTTAAAAALDTNSSLKRSRVDMEAAPADEATSFTCPICFKLLGEKMLQCQNSCPLICDWCYNKLKVPRSCPTCRVAMPAPIRNRFAEQMAQSSQKEYACTGEDCNFRGKYLDVCKHERQQCKSSGKFVDCLVQFLCTKMCGPFMDRMCEHMQHPDANPLTEMLAHHHCIEIELRPFGKTEFEIISLLVERETYTYWTFNVKNRGYMQLLCWMDHADLIHYTLVLLSEPSAEYKTPKKFQMLIKESPADKEYALKFTGVVNTLKEFREEIESPMVSTAPNWLLTIHRRTLAPFLRVNNNRRELHFTIRL